MFHLARHSTPFDVLFLHALSWKSKYDSYLFVMGPYNIDLAKVHYYDCDDYSMHFFLNSQKKRRYERCLIHCTHNWIFVPDALSIFFTQELASKLPPSKSRNGGPTFCVFTRSWFSVVGFVVWEVGCLRAVLTHLAYYVINVFKKKEEILG